MEKTIKKWLKALHFNEPTISTLLGGAVIIVVGILIFNYFKTGQTGEIGLGENIENGLTLENEKVLPETHKVAEGEDLWKISEKYYNDGYQWVEIAKANNLDNPDLLAIDQELTLPKLEKKPEIATEAKLSEEKVVAAAETTNAIEGNEYQVQEGDYLWSIALRAYGDGYKWVEIANTNNLLNPDLIEAGQTLTLPR